MIIVIVGVVALIVGIVLGKVSIHRQVKQGIVVIGGCVYFCREIFPDLMYRLRPAVRS